MRQTWSGRLTCVVAVGAHVAWCALAAAQNQSPATPVVTEPTLDRLVNPEDLHMECEPFSDPNPGDTHVCTDWEVRLASNNEIAWATLCIGGVERLHTHLGDGVFQNAHAGRRSFFPDTDYVLRVRHRDSSGDAATEWSAWGTRTFRTGTLSSVFALDLEDVVDSPAPTWTDTTGAAISLPSASVDPSGVVLEHASADRLLEFRASSGAGLVLVNPSALPEHNPVRVRAIGGSTGLAIPDSDIVFTDDTGAERSIFLPAITLPPGGQSFFWISSNGSSYAGNAAQTAPDFSTLRRGAAVPWQVNQPGFKVEIVATGFQLPVNIAFVPSPGNQPTSPLFYVTELYGAIKVVTRDGTVGTFASNLINFNPTGDFPGSGEQGLTGIAVDPSNGDVYATMLYDAAPPNGPHYPKVERFRSIDGGRTASQRSIILNMVGETQGQSHQISNITFGPDEKLYVHMGDGFVASTAQNLASFRGKILRLNRDGTPPADNPFYDGPPFTARDYVFAYGLRNPFGGAWRGADNLHYEVENGPSVDRIAQVVAGRNFGWNGTDASMRIFALYNWEQAVGPVNMAFIQPQTFAGSGFPASKQGNMYISESGGTYATGPQVFGKKITEFVLDPLGNRVSGPTPLISYNGSGKATVSALAAGPDGLYFSDLYKDQDAQSPIDPGANVLRVRFVGTADFSASPTTGPAPLSVTFTDQSNIPNPTAWNWSFGDGTTSTEQNPTHVYADDGLYTVRLAVTGSAGVVVSQKNAFVRVGASKRVAFIGASIPPTGPDSAAADFLRARGFDVVAMDDEPANRPSATQISSQFDLAIASSSIASANIAGEFRAAPVPLIFWENALLRTGRESLTDNGATVASQTAITIADATHPITQGLAGNVAVFAQAQTMSVGSGAIGSGVRGLARRTGSTDWAILAAESGAQGVGYVTPARRVFFFLEDNGFASLTPTGQSLLLRSACWALNGATTITNQPQDATLRAGQNAAFTVQVTGAGPFTFQWRRDGAPLSDGPAPGGGTIDGSRRRALSIAQVAGADAGQYSCVITGPCGEVVSSVATLAVTPRCPADFNNDGQADFFDYLDFANAFAGDDPAADFDANGQVDFFDYLDFAGAFAAGC
ncbi:MAG: PQQ-dependent sugar dehydrogenase [Planctomycetota bacterium]|nr:PQQ-dependent sugar dehydrogenase [Planctomycetota bacterium]